MFQRIYSAAISGLYGIPVEVECFIGSGLPYFAIVGVNGSSQDARERVRSALKSAGFAMPASRVIVNIRCLDQRQSVPAWSMSSLDLPIALSILACQNLVPLDRFNRTAWIGELSLNGELRSVAGALTMARGVMESTMPVEELYFPLDSAPEAALSRGGSVRSITDEMDIMEKAPQGKVSSEKSLHGMANIYGLTSLTKAVEVLRSGQLPDPVNPPPMPNIEAAPSTFDDIHGQEMAKRCALLTAAGMHHLLLIGPPGCGKTMLSSSIPSLLPPLTHQEQIELTEIYSCHHLLPDNAPMILERPFRAPHHSTSQQALLGGGAIPHAGEITLAHHGILFLDEFAEMPRSVMESLREPLEEGRVHISRVQGTFVYPADTLLIAAMNPCPCGYYPDESRCHCSPMKLRSYYDKVNSPVLDRMDIMLRMEALKPGDLEEPSQLTYQEAREIVARVHRIQQERFQQEGVYNSRMKSADIKKYCVLNTPEKNFMEDAMLRLGLSMRAYHKVLRLARTIADVEESSSIQVHHLAEALQYRLVLSPIN